LQTTVVYAQGSIDPILLAGGCPGPNLLGGSLGGRLQQLYDYENAFSEYS